MTKQEEGLSARGLSKTFNPQESEADIAATNTRKDKNNTSANFLASGSTAQVASSDSIAVDSFSVCREYPPGTMWTLYDNCSRAFLMTVKAAKGQEGVLNIKSSKMLASCSESLFLWGEGFESSDFDLLTQWSNDLNDAIIQYFLDISRCIIKGDVSCCTTDLDDQYTDMWQIYFRYYRTRCTKRPFMHEWQGFGFSSPT